MLPLPTSGKWENKCVFGLQRAVIGSFPWQILKLKGKFPFTQNALDKPGGLTSTLIQLIDLGKS